MFEYKKLKMTSQRLQELNNITKPLTWDEFSLKAIKELPESVKLQAIECIKSKTDSEFKEAVLKDYNEYGDWLQYQHFGLGMCIRNSLRDAGITDEKLPSCNWDDYYTQIVEIVVGIRNIDGDIIIQRPIFDKED